MGYARPYSPSPAIAGLFAFCSSVEQALEPVIEAAYDKGKEAGCRRQAMWK